MNITFSHSLLGEVSLKPLTVGDFTAAIQLLRDIADERLFCCHIISQQLVKPKVPFADIQNWDQRTLIEVAREFAKREKTISSHFRNTDDENFFTDFRRAFESYQRQWSERVAKMSLPLGDLCNQFAKTMSAAIQAYYDPVRLVAESAQKFAMDMQRLMEPIRKAIILFTEQYAGTFAKLAKFWLEFERIYKISKEEAVKILKRYKWFISPSFHIDFIFDVVSIGKKPGNHRKEINQLFIEYFSRNNFQNLKEMIERWKNNPLFAPRMKIIGDALAIFMHSVNTRRNYYTVVLTPLLAQIDGVFHKVLQKNGINIKNFRGGYEQKKNKFSKIGENVIDKELQELIQDIFLNVLFEKAHYGDATNYSFNRHKILHGEYLRYGRKDNVLRAFFILDFLSHF